MIITSEYEKYNEQKRDAIMPRYLPMGKAVQYSGVSRHTLYRMLEQGHISGDRTPGGHWRIDKESIDDWFVRSDKKAFALMRDLGL